MYKVVSDQKSPSKETYHCFFSKVTFKLSWDSFFQYIINLQWATKILSSNCLLMVCGCLLLVCGCLRSFVHSYLHRKSYSNGCKMFAKNKYINIYIYKYPHVYIHIYIYIYISTYIYKYVLYIYKKIYDPYMWMDIYIYYIYMYLMDIYTSISICISISLSIFTYIYILYVLWALWEH